MNATDPILMAPREPETRTKCRDKTRMGGDLRGDGDDGNGATYAFYGTLTLLYMPVFILLCLLHVYW